MLMDAYMNEIFKVINGQPMSLLNRYCMPICSIVYNYFTPFCATVKTFTPSVLWMTRCNVARGRKAIQATDSNADHILDDPGYAHWSKNTKYYFFFYRKVYNFQMVIILSRTTHKTTIKY